jgi:hypothetical protein
MEKVISSLRERFSNRTIWNQADGAIVEAVIVRLCGDDFGLNVVWFPFAMLLCILTARDQGAAEYKDHAIRPFLPHK